MSASSVCSSCQGTGHVLVSVPHVRCAYCGGSGSYKTYRCSVCGGRGLAQVEGPTVLCPECGGRRPTAPADLSVFIVMAGAPFPAGKETVK